MQQQFKRPFCFLIAGLFLFLSCQTEEISVSDSRQKHTKQVTKVSFSTFKRLTGLADFKTTFELPKNSNDLVARRSSGSYVPDDFFVDTSQITQTVVDGKTSYSFPITPKRREKEDNRYYLVVYDKAEKWLDMIIQSDFTKDAIGNPKETGYREIYANAARGTGCTTIFTWTINCNRKGKCADGTCDLCSQCLKASSERICGKDKEGYNDEGFTKPGQPDNGGGGFNPNPNPDPEDEEVVVTLPVLLENPKNNPCKELKKMMENSNIKDSYTGVNGLQSKVRESKEYGFAFKRNAGYDSVEPIPQDPRRPTLLNMKDFVGGNYYGANHIHINYVNSDAVPMFPGPDIDYLCKVATKYNWNGLTHRDRDYSIFVLTLTVPQGTYAIKIKNWFNFINVMNKERRYLQLKNEIQNKYNEIDNSNIDKLIKALLKTMHEFNLGVGLYVAESDFSNWKELTLANPNNPNSEIKEIPCN